MIDISPEMIALIMMGGVLVGVLTGFPLAQNLGIRNESISSRYYRPRT